MSVIGSNILAGSSGQGGGYTIDRSLRFRSSASAYLNRTPTVAGNQSTWTWSGWIKRGKIGVTNGIFEGFSTSSNITSFNFNGDALNLQLYASSSYNTVWSTTAVFRDPSSWYHVILAFDTTQATQANMVKIYVNGVQQTTSFVNYISAIPQNSSWYVNALGIQHFHNLYVGGASAIGDQYFAEVNFIDGQALTPSSFGEYSTKTGVWQPKKYAGTYGTNGFYLPFKDNTSTTTLSADSSGNGNNWTTNNISLTAGATYDSMTDVPTLTSATASNFCTLNPLDQYAVTNSDGNLQAYSGTTTANIRGTIAVSSGKWYWEVTAGTYATANTHMIGVCDATTAISSTSWSTANCWSYYASNGNKYNAGANSSYGATYTTGDVIGIALDMDNGTLTFYKNGVSQGTAYTGLTGKTLTSSFGTAAYTLYCQYNFGQRPFAYTPPTGFVALNTFNLPTPTIGATASTQANKYMDVSLYTGNATSPRSITGLGFQPDFTWIKNRSDAINNVLYDAVRGAGSGKALSSNSTLQEGLGASSDSINGYLSSFNSDGITVTAGSSTSLYVNTNTNAYVASNWKANGTGITNTDGSITSTVSANTSSGFSVITATSNGADPFTVGHGLGVPPKMYIFKNRDVSDGWYTWHTSLPSATDSYLVLNSTAAVASSTGIWGAGATSTTIGIRSAAIAQNTRKIVIYAFAEIAGYSKFGSYTGNGSADGTFVALPFKPKFIMVKESSGTGSWVMWDSARNTYNLTSKYLLAESSNAEVDGGSPVIDLLSNGFKLRGSSASTNESGATYIYMAFAEVPQKFSLGV